MRIPDGGGTATRAGAPAPDGAGRTGPSEARLDGDRLRFLALLGGLGEGGEAGDGAPAEESADGPTPGGMVPPFSGDAILRGLCGGPDPLAAPAGTEAPPPIGVDQIESLVSRMLVGDGALDGRQEVRLTLRQEVMPGTEIQISRADGRVRVELVTSDETSRATLEAHFEGLKDHLAGRLGEEAEVRITWRGSEAAAESDARRQDRRDPSQDRRPRRDPSTPEDEDAR